MTSPAMSSAGSLPQGGLPETPVAPESAPPTTDLTFPATDAEVRELPNGFEVVLRQDISAPVASVQAWVRTGSIHEGGHLGAGVSHLVEHLVFKGTRRRDTGAVARDIQSVGGYVNAYTSFDRTVYWADVPADGVATALDVITDLVGDALLPETEFEREKEVIRREIAMGNDDPGRAGSRLLFETVFREHPFRFPIIGHLELFNELGREDAWRYYRARYASDNVFFVVTGAIEPDAVVAALAERFGDRPRGGGGALHVAPEPAQLGRREARREFATELSRIQLAWRIPGVTHTDMPALDVLASVLGDGRSSRLHRRVRDEARLVHSIGSYAYTPSTEGLFLVSCESESKHRDAAVDAVLAEVGRLVRDGVGTEEVAKARNAALASQLHTLVTTRGQASDLGSNWLLTRNLDFTRDYVLALERVTPEHVREAASRYLVDRSLTCTSLDPRGSAAATARRARTRSEPRIERATLSNGLTVLVRETRAVPLAAVHSVFLGGLLAEGGRRAGLTALTASMLVQGTRSRPGAALAESVESLGGDLGASSGNNSFSVNLDLLSRDTAFGIGILGEVLREPAFAPTDLERERDALLASIRADEDHLLTVAFRELRRDLFGDHPYGWGRKGTLESVSSLGHADLAGFHEEYAVARNGVVAVFGDVHAAEVVEQAEAGLGSLAAGARAFAAAETPPLPAEGGAVREITRQKEQAVLAVGFRTGGIHADDRLALELIDEACSDMASRLFLRIREELGLAYYVGATRMLGLTGGSFVFYLGTSAAELDRAQEELLGLVRGIAAEGLDDEELERARRTLLGKQLMALQSHASLAQVCALDELYGFGFDHFRTTADRIAAVTRDDVAAAAAATFGSVEPFVVRVVPG